MKHAYAGAGTAHRWSSSAGAEWEQKTHVNREEKRKLDLDFQYYYKL